jgi:hypothetical protein
MKKLFIGLTALLVSCQSPSEPRVTVAHFEQIKYVGAGKSHQRVYDLYPGETCVSTDKPAVLAGIVEFTHEDPRYCDLTFDPTKTPNPNLAVGRRQFHYGLVSGGRVHPIGVIDYEIRAGKNRNSTFFLRFLSVISLSARSAF